MSHPMEDAVADERALADARSRQWSDDGMRERRERIATAALQGLLASDAGKRTMVLQGYAQTDAEETARKAVWLADALIVELDRERVEAKP